MKKRVATIKKIICTIIVAVFCIIATSCANSASAEQNQPLKIWFVGDNGAYEVLKVVDDDTGVNYVVVATAGSGNRSIAITPRLNADGTLYVK